MKPNILIVMTDHQRADTVLPEHPAITPNLTHFASQGITFTNTFCPSPHCCPSRATFFTGVYPSQHGVWNNVCNDQALSRGVNPGVRMWSEDLSRQGYQMHFIGKWHVSVLESPGDRGWEEHFVSGKKGDHHGVYWDHYRNLPPDLVDRSDGQMLRPGYGPQRLYGVRPDEDDHHDQTVISQTLETLETLGRSNQPWCVFCGLIGPHDPYLIPQRYLDQYPLDSIPLPVSYFDHLSDKPRIYKRIRNQLFDQLGEHEVREAIRHYWAYCTYLDDLFGQILQRLEETGQVENTLVIYCADHGDYCGEHGLFAKGIPCFQGAYRVPNIMRWPAGIKDPGRRVDSFASLVDFSPTLLEVAGMLTETNSISRSLAPFFSHELPVAWRNAVYTQCNGVELYYSQRSVMTQEFKYTFNGFDLDELYDLRTDPDEMQNINDDPIYLEVKKDLLRQMWQFAYQTGDTMINPYITVGIAPWGPGVAFR